jgi:hypothetical protein
MIKKIKGIKKLNALPMHLGGRLWLSESASVALVPAEQRKA